MQEEDKDRLISSALIGKISEQLTQLKENEQRLDERMNKIENLLIVISQQSNRQSETQYKSKVDDVYNKLKQKDIKEINPKRLSKLLGHKSISQSCEYLKELVRRGKAKETRHGLYEIL